MSNKTPEQLSQEAAERIRLASQAAAAGAGEFQPAEPSIDQRLAEELSLGGMTPESLEAVIAGVLAKQKAEKIASGQLKEPDYATLTEQDAYNPALYIPVIDHEVPEYMNIELVDKEYGVVWANRDQRRVSMLLAEGYELLKPEHIARNFKLPLKFESDAYVYQDVIAMRVHKRILFGKRRKVQELSRNQLNPKAANLTKRGETQPALDGALGQAFADGAMKFF